MNLSTNVLQAFVLIFLEKFASRNRKMVSGVPIVFATVFPRRKIVYDSVCVYETYVGLADDDINIRNYIAEQTIYTDFQLIKRYACIISKAKKQLFSNRNVSWTMMNIKDNNHMEEQISHSENVYKTKFKIYKLPISRMQLFRK